MLQIIWFILWTLLWAVYFVLDGFDLEHWLAYAPFLPAMRNKKIDVS